ncbi:MULTISPECIES: 50S ribosomal protein L25/general stress protein Ctc [unclassified Thioalkalivibrio]|uniref:50S ribosomal protein L25/general stress protein Ctc n=1 Tax=unclassified Thioalkalivibrio TaxID=2621013 RepID=UPI0003782AA6|nr:MULTISPECIES: 50S ribosomal protein L25/general stress protein Ctc [unclassified Thioalkalivibrio]
MSMSFTIEAEKRDEQGSSASRRLRRAGKLPAILYGGENDAQPITLDHNAMVHNLKHDAFYSHILTVKLDGKSEKAILRDVQRHPFKPTIYHVDLLRVSANQPIRVHVPLHFHNEEECKGVKLGGGMVSRMLNDIEVECLPGDLPESIDIDVVEMDVGDTIHISELKLPKGVESVALMHGEDYDYAVVSVLLPRAAKAEEEEGEEVEAAEAEGAEAEGGEEASSSGDEGGSEDKE